MKYRRVKKNTSMTQTKMLTGIIHGPRDRLLEKKKKNQCIVAQTCDCLPVTRLTRIISIPYLSAQGVTISSMTQAHQMYFQSLATKASLGGGQKIRKRWKHMGTAGLDPAGCAGSLQSARCSPGKFSGVTTCWSADQDLHRAGSQWDRKRDAFWKPSYPQGNIRQRHLFYPHSQLLRVELYSLHPIHILKS